MDAQEIAELIAKPYRYLSEFDYDLPNGLVLAWLPCGPAFQLDFDLATDRGADDLVFWWIGGGRRNSPGIGDALDREILRNLHVQHLMSSPPLELPGLTPLMSLIYRHREDLQASIDIDIATGQNEMWRWWLSFGLEEYFRSPDWVVAAQVKTLHRLNKSVFRRTGLIQPTPMVMLAWNAKSARQQVDLETAAGQSALWQAFFAAEAITFGLPSRGLPYIPDGTSRTDLDRSDPVRELIPPSLAVIGVSRPDLQAAFGHSTGGLSGLIYWWLTDGREDFPDLRDQVDQELLQSLHLDFLPSAGPANPALTPLLRLIRNHRSDLCSAFDVASSDGIAGMWCWWLSFGLQEYFESPDWVVAAQVRALHRLNTSFFRTTGLIQPTPMVMLAWNANSGRQQVDLESAAGQSALWQAFFAAEAITFGLPSRGLPYIPDGTSRTDLDRSDSVRGLIPTSLAVIGVSRPDLQAAFGHNTGGLSSLVYWWLTDGREEFPDLRDQVDQELLQSLHLDFLPSTGQTTPALTPLLRLIRDHRPDLMKHDVGDRGFLKIWLWWFVSGRVDILGQLDWLVREELRALHTCDAHSFERSGVIPPTTLVRMVSEMSFDGHYEPNAFLRIASCWTDFLLRDKLSLNLPDRGMPYVLNTFADPTSRTRMIFGGLFPEEFALIYTSRADLMQNYDSLSEAGLMGLLLWWLDSGRSEYPYLQAKVDTRILQSLEPRDHREPNNQLEDKLPPLLSMIWRQREDLRSAFDVASSDGIAGMRRWWIEHGERETFGSRLRRLEQMPSPDAPSGLYKNDDRRSSSSAPYPLSACASKSSVGLFGYAKGEFGLGEDVRLLRAALDEVNVANVVINAPWQIVARQSIDEPSVEAADALFDSDIMFYVMPPFDTVTLLDKMGPHAFSARRKIGFWQWELERFPAPAELALNLVDEIWCHSEHAAHAYRQATDKPVFKVPLPVSVPETRIVSRATFGLPDEAFLVFTSFDGASAIARKNPLAAMLSFQKAFPKGGNINARLIVKAMNTNNDSLWRECLRRASVDKRIVIIDMVMDRHIYYELLRACDVVISLHRAEGFGRLMAEAMALGIPVIASRYSGNLDFMTDENSWLIDGDLIPVLPGDYSFHQGQVWLEPSVEKAAAALRECAIDRKESRRRAVVGMADIVSKYSLKGCGEAYSKLLDRPPTDLNRR